MGAAKVNSSTREDVGLRLLGFLALLGIVTMAGGCAPVISQETLKAVDEGLDFEAVLENPERYLGASVLLGGDIIETLPVPGETQMLVLQHPLGFRNKPSKEKGSKGRFIVVAQGFMDPAIYRSGRQVTVVGRVAGKDVRPIGEIEYAYPLIEMTELYLWPLEEAVNEPRFYFGVGIGKTF
jgi:outer membrane lipoprotein